MNVLGQTLYSKYNGKILTDHQPVSSSQVMQEKIKKESYFMNLQELKDLTNTGEISAWCFQESPLINETN